MYLCVHLGQLQELIFMSGNRALSPQSLTVTGLERQEEKREGLASGGMNRIAGHPETLDSRQALA